MKRFAWLWSAVLGAVLLPLLMATCSYIGERYWVPLRGTNIALAIPIILARATFLSEHWGVWCGLVSCCGVLLGMGHRSLWWRLLSAVVGAGTTGYIVWRLWTDWRPSPFASGNNSSHLLIYTAIFAPLLLASLLLVFFALILRSPRSSANWVKVI